VLSEKIENFKSTEARLNASLLVLTAVVKSVVKKLVAKKQGAERGKKSKTSRAPRRA
jgi:ABC-type sulfate transport system permease subunit